MTTRAPRAACLSHSLKSFDSDTLFVVPFKEALMRAAFLPIARTAVAPN
jgi:hypothetical protein